MQGSKLYTGKAIKNGKICTYKAYVKMKEIVFELEEARYMLAVEYRGRIRYNR